MQSHKDNKIKTKRTCIQDRHNRETPKHICTFDKCNLNNRWVCFKCALENIHNHGMKTQDHIMANEKFLQYIQEKEQYRFEYYKELLKSIEQFIKELQNLSQTIIQSLEKEKIRIKEENNINFIENCIKIMKNDFYQLSNKEIIKLINIEKTLIQFDDQKIRKFMEQQKILSQDFIIQMQNISDKLFKVQEKQHIQKFNKQQNNYVEESTQSQKITQNLDLKCSNEFQQRLQQFQPKIEIVSSQQRPRSQDHNYSIQQNPTINILRITQIDSFYQQQDLKAKIKIVQQNQQLLKYNLATKIELNDKINTLFISSNGKFLILRLNNGQIQIHDLNQDKILETIELDNIIIVCICDNASNYLACGDSKGNLQLFNLQDHFIQIYNKKIHNSIILNIKFINYSSLITCSEDKNIIITNFINKQMIKIQCQQDTYIYDIEYDAKEQIIISSCNKTINFLSQENSTIIFNEQNAHEDVVSNIQLIPKNNCLISSDYKVIKIWSIDYKNKQLKNLEIFEFKNYLSTFYQIIHKANFVLVSDVLSDYTNDNQIQVIDETFWLYKFLSKTQITKYIIFLKSDFNQRQSIQIFKQEELCNSRQ